MKDNKKIEDVRMKKSLAGQTDLQQRHYAMNTRRNAANVGCNAALLRIIGAAKKGMYYG